MGLIGGEGDAQDLSRGTETVSLRHGKHERWTELILTHFIFFFF